MAIGISLTGVQFQVGPMYESEEAHESGEEPVQVALGFKDMQSGIEVVCVFDKGGWANFKRHVEGDGKLPSDILVAGAADLTALSKQAPPPSAPAA